MIKGFYTFTLDLDVGVNTVTISLCVYIGITTYICLLIAFYTFYIEKVHKYMYN